MNELARIATTVGENPKAFVEVDKDTFYGTFTNMDVVLETRGDYPYVTAFKRRLVRDTVGIAGETGLRYPYKTRYLLRKDFLPKEKSHD